MTAGTPAQAAAVAFVTGCTARGITASAAAVPPEGKLDIVRELWADVAQDAVAAYIEANKGDPVDPVRIIAEVIVPELAAVTAERDGLRKALHAIELGVTEPSPKWVAGEALNGRYFDPEADAGVWSTADPAAAVRATMAQRDYAERELNKSIDATAELRALVAEILREVELGTLGQHNAAATSRTLARTAQWRERARRTS